MKSLEAPREQYLRLRQQIPGNNHPHHLICACREKVHISFINNIKEHKNGMKANLLGFDVLCYLAQTAARRSLSGSRSHRASGAPGCRSGGDNVAMWMRSGEPSRLRLPVRTHVEAFVRGEKLGHGAEGHGVRAAVLQRLRRLAHQQAGRHQPGGHFCQFELEKLQRERIPEGQVWCYVGFKRACLTRLVVGQRLAELLPYQQVIFCELYAGVRRPQRTGGCWWLNKALNEHK